MTPQEMHIGIDLDLQKLNANVTSSIEPEEKDWFLTEEMFRFIKQRIRRISNDKKLGLQEDQKRYDDLEDLITTAILPVYIKDTNSVFTFLPANYFSLINDRSLTKDLCGQAYSPIVSDISLYTAFWEFPSNSTDLYKTMIIVLNSVTIFRVIDYFPNGIPNESSRFELINLIIQTFNSIANFECKYESYQDKYKKGSIVLASTNNTTFTLKNTYNVTPVDQVFSITSTTYSKISTVVTAKEHANRLSKTELIYSQLDTSFDNTYYFSPISTLQKSKLNAWHSKKFILSGLNIDYIRRPRKISLSLNQSCELSEDVHSEIVASTAKRLAGITQSEDYKNLINENLLKE